MKGNRAQDVFFRVVKLDAQGAVLDARYYNTYSFRWADAVYGVPGMGAGAGSATAARFYGAVLDQRVFWEHTFAVDGVMRFELPASNATDGNMLAKLVWHSVVRDMIIRADTWFPRYGIQGQWSYGAMGNDNCDITLRSSMELALEIGAFDFARGVLENFFRCKCSRFLCVFFRSSKQRLHRRPARGRAEVPRPQLRQQQQPHRAHRALLHLHKGPDPDPQKILQQHTVAREQPARHPRPGQAVPAGQSIPWDTCWRHD